MKQLAATLALLASVLLAASCVAKPAAAPVVSAPPTATPEVDDQHQKIDELKAKLRAHWDSAGCALPEVVAFDPDRNLTSLTIDQAILDLPDHSPETSDERTILCHVVELIALERLKTFTSRADKQFFLEAQGHPTLHASMGTGGFTRPDGVVRYAILHLIGGEMVPGVEYTLRPRNEVDGYKWVVPDSVSVARAD